MSLSERAAKTAKVAEEPQLYKVCEGCDSIVAKRVTTCPSCHGYRFNEDAEAVVLQAKLLGAREKTRRCVRRPFCGRFSHGQTEYYPGGPSRLPQ